MEALAPLARRFVSWNESAMRPSAVLALLNDIVVHGRSCVVECGGGISTMFMARLLAERGGHLHTIEHDPNWAAILESAVRAEALGTVASVITAPLRPSTFQYRGAADWYDGDIVAAALDDHRPDLLVVDGPPAYDRSTRHSRYAAGPFFADRLSENCTIVLDDINRRGEQEIAARWARDLGIRFERRFVAGSIAVGRRGPSFDV